MKAKTFSEHSFFIAVFLIAFSSVAALEAQHRPGKHPAFSEGFRAFKLGQWEETVEWMLEALEAWPEDGEFTRVYGRWFEPYVPRYYLGAALFELGCYELALEQFDESILSAGGGERKLQREFESLKLKSERFVRQGIAEAKGSDCSKWHLTVSRLIGEPEND